MLLIKLISWWNLFLFIFAADGLDYRFKMKLLSPFPIKRSVSR